MVQASKHDNDSFSRIRPLNRSLNCLKFLSKEIVTIKLFVNVRFHLVLLVRIRTSIFFDKTTLSGTDKEYKILLIHCLFL